MIKVKKNASVNKSTANEKLDITVGSLIGYTVGVLLAYCSLILLFLGPLQEFAYQPLYVANFNYLKAIIGGFLLIILVFFMPKTEKTPAALFLWLVFLLMIVPRVVVFACRNDGLLYLGFTVSAFMTVLFVSLFMRASSLPRFVASKRNQVTIQKFALLVAILLVVCTVGGLAVTQGIPTLRAFNFAETYEMRASVQLSSVLDFLSNALGTYVLPLIIAFFLASKRVKAALVLSMAELSLFMWTSNKGWLFCIFLLWGFYLLTVRKCVSSAFITWMYGGILASLAIVLCLLEIDSEWAFSFFSLFVRRTIFIPSILGSYYFDFFQGHDWILLQNTVLSFLTPMSNQYSIMSFQNQIGLEAFGTNSNWANTGLFGGEYAQFGPLSWFVIVFNLLLLIKVLDRETINEGAHLFLTFTAVLFAEILLNASSVRLMFSLTGVITMVLFLFFLSSFRLVNETHDSAGEPEK